MKKLWKKWCNKVDKHNSLLGYDNYEEYWDYTTIFAPLLEALVMTFIAWALSVGNMRATCIVFIISLISFSLLYWLNWWLVETENQEEDDT